MDRRTALSTLAAASSLGAGRALANSNARKQATIGVTEKQCLALDAGPTADRFPQHALVFDQHGRKFRFYEDLIKNKTVMMHFMSTALEADFRTVENLRKVQDILGNRLGRDYFLYSITVDPETDSPRVLADYAAQHNVGPGWMFLTGDPKEVNAIKDSLFFRPQGHPDHGHGGSLQDCSMGLIRYGNDRTGLWGAVPTRSEPNWIAARLFWVTEKSGPKTTQKLVRRGPPARIA